MVGKGLGYNFIENIVERDGMVIFHIFGIRAMVVKFI